MNNLSAPDFLLSAFFEISDSFRRIALEAQASYSEMLSGMTVRQHRVIKEVSIMTETQPDGISLKELSERIELSAAATSELVESLVQKNILTRKPCPVDRRAVRITLSDMTQDIISVGKKTLLALCGDMLAKLSEDEKKNLFVTLDKFKNILK